MWIGRKWERKEQWNEKGDTFHGQCLWGSKNLEDIGEQIIKAQAANLCLRATIGKVGRNEVVTIIEYHDNTHIHQTVESGNWNLRKREDHKENLVGRITLLASCGLEWSQKRRINPLILGHAYSLSVFFSISLVSGKGHMTLLVNKLWLEMCHFQVTVWPSESPFALKRSP